jgi:nicotinamidase-related amidase
MDFSARSYAGGPVPLLLCVNMQDEFLPRNGTRICCAQFLAACAEIVGTWRERYWPVAHAKRISPAALADPKYGIWLPDWRPRPGEMVFDHFLPSAFSSAKFSEYIENICPVIIVTIGVSLDEVILSTVIDGFNRGHRLGFFSDAVQCLGSEDLDPEEFRKTLIRLVRRYAQQYSLCESEP